MLDSTTLQYVMWLLDGPEILDNRGANPSANWSHLQPYKAELLSKHWAVRGGGAYNRVYVTDREAFLDFLIEKGVANQHDIGLLQARFTLDLMEG